MRARTVLAGLFVVVIGMGLTTLVTLAGFAGSGAGGCGNFDVVLNAAQSGDVLAPMRSSGLNNTTGAIISKTLVIQGGWDPATGDCNSAGTNQFADAAAMTAAGFTYTPAQRTDVFGDGTHAALPLSLTSGQTLVLQNLNISSGSAGSNNGYAISGTLNNGARLRLENMNFNANQAGTNASGGAIYLEVRGGSQLVIANSSFTFNNAIAGGALEVRLYDNSSLLIENSTFGNNNALTGNGGAIRVLIDSGSVSLVGNTFTSNSSTNGSGGAIAIERAPSPTGSASWSAAGNTFSGNSAPGAGTADIYATVDQLTPPRLPAARPAPGSQQHAGDHQLGHACRRPVQGHFYGQRLHADAARPAHPLFLQHGAARAGRRSRQRPLEDLRQHGALHRLRDRRPAGRRDPALRAGGQPRPHRDPGHGEL